LATPVAHRRSEKALSGSQALLSAGDAKWRHPKEEETMIPTQLTGRLRTIAAIATLTASTLTLAACGSSDGDDPAAAADDAASDGEVASLGTVAPATADTGQSGTDDGDEPTEAEMQQAALDYAKCMREHGVDMPDPQFNTDGGGGGVAIQIGGPGAEIDPEEMQAADDACKSIMEEIRGQFEPPDPEQLERMKQEALEFAECMREHGVDMPDPQFSEDGAMTVAVGGGRLGEQGSGADPIDTDAFEAASEACGGPGGGMVAIDNVSGDGDAPEVMVNADVNVDADSGAGE
jgi:hypothetical protein